MSRLKRALFDFYGGFADKRIKNLDKGTTFIVDGRSTSDLGGDRKPFATFCLVFADVVSESEVRVNLSGNIPGGGRTKLTITTRWPTRQRARSLGSGASRIRATAWVGGQRAVRIGSVRKKVAVQSPDRNQNSSPLTNASGVSRVSRVRQYEA